MNIYASPAYFLIRDYYGEQRAQRSNVRLINHIHEGIWILQQLGANTATQEAYCVHPIFQSDEALLTNYQDFATKIRAEVLLLAMEYRHIANAYLSKRTIAHWEEIQLSPLREVNQLLIADKVQNRKDFELYHWGTHPRSNELDTYFKNWLQRLGIDEHQYQIWAEALKKLV